MLRKIQTMGFNGFFYKRARFMYVNKIVNVEYFKSRAWSDLNHRYHVPMLNKGISKIYWHLCGNVTFILKNRAGGLRQTSICLLSKKHSTMRHFPTERMVNKFNGNFPYQRRSE